MARVGTFSGAGYQSQRLSPVLIVDRAPEVQGEGMLNERTCFTRPSSNAEVANHKRRWIDIKNGVLDLVV
jgi:hypothetical protein